MSEQLSSVEVTSPPGKTTGAWSIWFRRLETADTKVVCVAIFVFAFGVLFLWRLFLQLEAGDAAIWDYVAQGILRGEVPYRDVIEIKCPGSAYLSAFAMWLGRFAGLRDVMSVRFMQMALTALLTVVTFLVAESFLRERKVALIASLLPLTSDHFVSWAEGGTQPKLTMILFGMLTLLLIANDRPFSAGIFSILSFLCWQPGLLFTGVAILVFSRYLTSWRDWRALKVLAGAAVPLAVAGMYFYSAGALGDLWTWTIAYNFAVYAPDGLRSPAETLNHVWAVLNRVFKTDIVWFLLGLVGLCLYSVARVVRGLRLKLGIKAPDSLVDALLMSALVYIAFCLVNLQSGPDLIPLFPFFAVFVGWLIAESARRLSSIRPATKSPSLGREVVALPAVALLLVVVVTVVRAATYRLEEWSLGYQDSQLEVLSELVGPDDKLYVHGAVEILLLLNRPNLNPYIMWDHGKARYVAAQKYGGSIDNMVGAIEAEHPKVVVVARLRHVPEGVALEKWIEEHYQKLQITGYDAYLRKQ